MGIWEDGRFLGLLVELGLNPKRDFMRIGQVQWLITLNNPIFPFNSQKFCLKKKLKNA